MTKKIQKEPEYCEECGELATTRFRRKMLCADHLNPPISEEYLEEERYAYLTGMYSGHSLLARIIPTRRVQYLTAREGETLTANMIKYGIPVGSNHFWSGGMTQRVRAKHEKQRKEQRKS